MDIKMKIIRLKLFLLAPIGQRPELQKLHLILRKIMLYIMFQYFSVLLISGSNPANINQFQNHT